MITPNNKWRRYITKQGICINSDCETVIEKYLMPYYEGKIQLILTSPPFPLKRAKRYGNRTGADYLEWLCNIGKKLKPLLTDTGSIVIEIGNAWNSGEPTYSTLPIETLLAFKRQCELHLCQEFIYYNPARLPGPIEWVNKERIRVKDSFTQIWWMSKTPYPYANNRAIAVPYSKRMQKLLSNGQYNSGVRPSEHKISETAFTIDNGGAIPANVIIAANTSSTDRYLVKCKEKHYPIHPARMAPDIPEFFIRFLTNSNDIVLDCFAGSNTTGAVAEELGRRWVSIELDRSYYDGSKFRFKGK